jgi:transposase
MSLDPSPIEPVPEETARVARAIFPKGNRYLLLRDTLGTLFTDPLFADLFPSRGQPALARLSTGSGDALSVYRRAAGSASG